MENLDNRIASTGNSMVSDSATQQLAARCVEHLDQEIELLTNFVSMTNQIQHVLGVVSQPTDQSISDLQQTLISESSRLAKARKNLQGVLGNYLNTSAEQATIRKFTELLPRHLAEPINQRRGKILQLESEVRQLNRTNTLLLQQSLDIYESIIVGITGQKPPSPTYSASGQIDQQSSGNLLQTEC